MTIFNAEIGYWIGMGAVVTATIAYIAVCWLLPPKNSKLKSIDKQPETVYNDEKTPNFRRKK